MEVSTTVLVCFIFAHTVFLLCWAALKTLEIWRRNAISDLTRIGCQKVLKFLDTCNQTNETTVSLSQVTAILRDVMGDKKFYFLLFFIVHLCNDPCHYILSPQCIQAGFCVIWNIVHSMSPIQYHSVLKFYRDPGKGKVIADCIITTTPIALIFTGYCLFLMFYRFI